MSRFTAPQRLAAARRAAYLEAPEPGTVKRTALRNAVRLVESALEGAFAAN
jgi:hypothetical protein